MRKFLPYILCCMFVGCGISKNADTNTTESDLVPADEIVFMAFKISNGHSQKNSKATFINTTKAAAKLKNQPEPNLHSGNFLTAEIYTGSHLLQTIQIEHPLFVHIEYPDDSGQYVSKDAILDEAEFFIRFTAGHADNIRIFETLNKKNRQELLALKI